MSPPYNIQERTFEFSVSVVFFCKKIWGSHEVTRLLARQLVRSATSVGANMEEADGGQTKPDFRTKVATARKESKEAVYWLRLIAATEPSLRGTVSPLLDEANQIASIVTTIGRNAQSSDSRGRTIVVLLLVAILYGILRMQS